MKMRLKMQLLTVAIAAVLCALFREPVAMCVVLVGCIGLLLAEQALWEYRSEQRMTGLIDYLTAVQDRLELPNLRESEEGAFGILQSEIYKVVALLRESYGQEAQQKRYMADMLSDISHQIKTPIAAISIMTELLETPGLAEEQRMEYAVKIESQLNRITWLIRTLLNLSQIEAGVVKLQWSPVKLRALFDKVCSSFELIAEVKEIELAVDIADEIIVNCDEQWTIEAFSNIVKNCIEHTPEGGRISVWASQDNLATRIWITDNGEGIEKEHLSHIFERFYKASASSNSVGIGLAMTKEIIMKQNGVISARSERGRGTEFEIKLYR